ncbi:MAG: primosomal protein N' (replication factor Y) - superfamily II helicase [Rhodobacteraceae bacterium]|nr:primosomal protein N' (replication factor Y) - superfamily II helicase [Paracoccaceae bacterium]
MGHPPPPPRKNPWARKKPRAPKPPAKKQAVENPRDKRDFSCPNCGADLRFDPAVSMMKCTHCEAEVEVPHVDDAAAHEEVGLRDRLASGVKMETVEIASLNCSTCGASVEFDPDEHSRLCPFCDSAIVADVTMQRSIVPQGLLPFAIEEKEAHAHMGDWLHARWFAPNGIRHNAASESFNGVYVPTWTYDAYTATAYTGKRGRRVRSGKTTTMRWTRVSGAVTGSFDDILVSGSQSVSVEFKDALAPWPLHALETYQTEFLAGFRAENHTIDLEEGYAESQIFMRAKIRDWIKADIGGDAQIITSADTRFSDETFKHVLLPVWITHYTLGNRRYRMSINGQTGKVFGQRPFSNLKLAAGALAGFLALALLGGMLSASFGPDMRPYQNIRLSP